MKNRLKSHSLVIVLLMATSLPSTAASLTAQVPIKKLWTGKADCQFMPPNSWLDNLPGWQGGCLSGKADGKGVLVALKGGANEDIFYGIMLAGQISLGVIESATGYVAGRFIDGEVLGYSDMDNQAIVDAFYVASAAALNYSERLKNVGQSDLSIFYSNKSAQLRRVVE